MNKIIKKSLANGIVIAPPSKSYAHRMLIGAFLSKAECKVNNIALSKDIIATIDAMEKLGAKVSVKGSQASISYEEKVLDNVLINCNESGSTLRFFIPIALMFLNHVKFTGTKRLMERDLSVYFDIFKQDNIFYRLDNKTLTLNGSLKGGCYKVKGNISSQFITGLLFSLPLLKNDTIIELIPPIESYNYILMTIDVLNKFGIKINFNNETNTLFVKGGQTYKKTNLTVEADYSNAAFLDAFNYVGGNVLVEGLNPDSLQGDKVYKEYFDIIKNNTHPTIDISNSIDLGPILFVMASIFNGAYFTGTSRLIIKESNRINDVLLELSKFGVEYKIYDNEVDIICGCKHQPIEKIQSHNDHRIVMAFTILLSKYGGIICDAEACSKSFPDFFDCINRLGIEVENEIN